MMSARLNSRAARLAAGAALVALVLAGCPNPIDVDVAARMTDDAPPFVSIQSPADGEQFSQTVIVSGFVEDPDGSIHALDYVVSGALGVLREETVDVGTVGTDGSYTFSFSTVGFDGPVELRVIATDWNDNTATDSVSLQYSGSQLSSFSAEPANKSVRLGWEALPDADSYTIYYTDNGTLPTEEYGTAVQLTSPGYELTGARNGALYTFLLSADISGEPEYWSGYVRTIPLSRFTLAPRVRGEYRRIEVEWQSIPGVAGYEVYRATSPDGPFSNYTGTITGNTYTDAAIAEGAWYYYKVRPAIPDAALSTYNGAQGLAIPETSERIRSVATPAPTRKVAVAGDYSYVAAGSAGLLVMDIGEPAAPRLAGSVPTTDAQDVAVDGTTVFVADGPGGVAIVDAAIPSSPRLLATYTGGIGNAIRIGVDRVTDQLFVIDDTGGTELLALDVANPAAPALIDTISETDRSFFELAVVEGVSGGTASGVYVVSSNVDPAQGGATIYAYLLDESSSVMGLAGSRFFDAGGGDDLPVQIAVGGSQMYLLEIPSGMVSGSRPYSLRVYSGLYDSTPGEYTNLDGFPADLAYADDRLVAVDEYKLQVLDVSDPNNPDRIYELDTPAKPIGVAMKDGDYAFVAAGTPSFQTVDLQQQATLSVVGSYTDPSVADVRVRGDLAYLATSSTGGLRVLDVSAAGSPDPLGFVPIDFVTGVAISGDYAFVSASGDGLAVVNIGDPNAPEVIGTADPVAGALNAIEIRGDFAYAAGRAGLEIFDISDPASPTGIGFVDSGTGGMQDVSLRGDRVYVSEGSYFEPDAFKIVDISTPTDAALVDEIPDPTSSGVFGVPAGVAAADGYALLAESSPGGFQGIHTIDVDPGSLGYLTVYGPYDPVDGETTNDLHPVRGIELAGGYAFAGTSEAGVVMLDVADPTAPVRVDETGSLNGEIKVIRASGSMLYAAAQFGTTTGLHLIELR
jgi:hypothetical protein